MKNNIKKDFNEFINGFKVMFNDLKTKGKRHKQIPNLITLSRLVFAFAIPPLAMSGGLINLIIAAILTIIAACTDGLDGLAARKLDAISEFGKNLDPVCDKIFAGALLIPLMIKLSPLLTLGLGVNLALEMGIAGVNLNSKAKGNVPRTTMIGKVKTGMLSILLASLYVSFSYQAISAIIPIIYALTTTTQALTLVNYYQIDKKKDLKKKTVQSTDNFNMTEVPENSKNEKDLENNKNYSVDDYRKLREEVIRTHSKTLEETNNFQKTK